MSTGLKVALFPGQGSQQVGMGKSLHENFKLARDLFEEASDAIHVDLKRLCFDGPESDLLLTENTQPCLLTTSVAAFRVARNETGFEPNAVAGHSLGEYSALVAAGSLKLEHAVRWVRARGEAMQRAVPAGEGKMAAIMGLDDDAVSALCERACHHARDARAAQSASGQVEAWAEPANFNAPGQVVIAGSSDGIEAALQLIQSGEFPGGKAIPLAVSAPFHCKLMRAARDRMAELFSKASEAAQPGNLLYPYVPNRTARLTSEKGLVFELLVEQVDHPVLWKQSIQGLIESQYAQGFEFGPGKVLQGLGKRIAKPLGKPFETVSVGDAEAIKALGGHSS